MAHESSAGRRKLMPTRIYQLVLPSGTEYEWEDPTGSLHQRGLIRIMAAEGHPEVQQHLGTELIWGEPTQDRDVGEGVYWLARAAKNNNWDATFMLADMYDKGEYGVDVDHDAATEAYRRAAIEGDHTASQLSLAYNLAIGQGTDKNEPEAVAWFTVVTNRGKEPWAQMAGQAQSQILSTLDQDMHAAVMDSIASICLELHKHGHYTADIRELTRKPSV